MKLAKMEQGGWNDLEEIFRIPIGSEPRIGTEKSSHSFHHYLRSSHIPLTMPG